MSTTAGQSKLQKICFICKILSTPQLVQVSPLKSVSPQPSKKVKGQAIAKPDGKRLSLYNEQTKSEIIKYFFKRSVIKIKI